MLLCWHDLSLGCPHQKRSSKRRERWQEGSLTQHKGRGSHVTATEHFPGSQCWGTLLSWFCSLITGDAPNALGRAVNVRHHQPPRRWGKGDVGSKPHDEWKGISSSTSEQAAWHSSLDVERAGGRNWPTAPRTPSSCLNPWRRPTIHSHTCELTSIPRQLTVFEQRHTVTSAGLALNSWWRTSGASLPGVWRSHWSVLSCNPLHDNIVHLSPNLLHHSCFLIFVCSTCLRICRFCPLPYYHCPCSHLSPSLHLHTQSRT